MKIGMLLDEPFPPDPRVENEALALIAAGHEVYLFCISFSTKTNERTAHKGIEVYRYPLPPLMRSISALAYTVPYYHWRLRSLVRSFISDTGVEVLHVHDVRIARTAFWVNRSTKLPVVLDLHENRPEIMKFYGHVRSFFGRLLIYPEIWKRWEFEFIQKADRLIVVTEAAKAYYTEQTGKPGKAVTVVPNTVREAFYTDPVIDPAIVARYQNDFVILYLGETGERRGLSTAVAAMPDILAAIPTAKLVIVGASIFDETLAQQARQLGVAERVDQCGYQDFTLFQSFLAASAVGICPLHRNLHHDTTYANKIFQYLSFGKPIVVSDCTAQAAVVSRYECGVVFPAQDVGAFANAVKGLQQDETRYLTLSENAKRAVRQDLRWEIYSQDLVALYEEVAAGVGKRSKNSA